MTLIVNFPAEQGFVLGADTEETCPSYDAQGQLYENRKQVQKIAPETAGNFQYAIVGSGHAGLIDSFIVRARRAVSICTQLSAPSLREVLETALGSFYRNDVAVCPDADKSLKLFIPYFCPHTKEYGVWVSEQTVLRDAADKPEMIGWEHELYTSAASRLFRPGMPLAQAVLAVLYILKIGDQTSKYIREPFHVAIVRPNGIWMEKDDYIASMTQRLHVFEQQVNNIFLACADSSIHAFRLEEMIEEFSQTAVELHRQHIDEQVGRMTMQDLMTANDAVPRLPPGSIIELNAFHGLQFIHDAERLDAQTVQFKSRWQQAKPLLEKLQRGQKEDHPPKPSDPQKPEDQ